MAVSAKSGSNPRASWAAELIDWKVRQGVAPEAMVFRITGGFPAIRKALVDRGWVENKDKCNLLWNLKYALTQSDLPPLGQRDHMQAINFFPRCHDLTSKIGLVTTLYRSCILDRVDVDTFFPRCYDLNNASHVESFVQDFRMTTCVCLLRRFVAGGGRTSEGSATATGSRQCFPRAVVAAALEVCRRRSQPVDDFLDEAVVPAVTDEAWQLLGAWSLKQPGKQLRPWGRAPRAKASSMTASTAVAAAAAAAAGAGAGDRGATKCPDVSGSTTVASPDLAAGDATPRSEGAIVDEDGPPEADDGCRDEGGAPLSDESDGDDSDSDAADLPPSAADAPATSEEEEQAELPRCEEDDALFQEAQRVLDALKGQLPQYELDGMQNIWVLKPAGKSRGRGISLSSRLEKIVDVGAGRRHEVHWVVQKYIEHPLIIENKKFDIRQWVLVTRFYPLSAWFYQDCYLRFTFADYDPSKLANKFAHLTNNSISKHASNFEEHVDETMWHSDMFSEYLKGLGVVRDGQPVEDPWLELVQPAMKEVVVHSLTCAQESVDQRGSCFQLFGYDFMVSEDLRVWLLEVNSSPDLSYSTATTRELVKQMSEDLVRVVVDIEKFAARKERPHRKWSNCDVDSGRFEPLEPAMKQREERFQRSHIISPILSIEGVGIDPVKPRPHECLRGPGAADARRWDALSLLQAASGEVPGEAQEP